MALFTKKVNQSKCLCDQMAVSKCNAAIRYVPMNPIKRLMIRILIKANIYTFHLSFKLIKDNAFINPLTTFLITMKTETQKKRIYA